MNVSQACIDLIKKYEVLRLTAYKCPANIWTIGYGSTIFKNKPVSEGLIITEEEAEEQLRHDVKVFAVFVKCVLTNIKRINQSQFDAMVSFTYNIGKAAFKSSTLLKKVNKNPLDVSIADEFERWVYAGGKILKGLERRRAEEAKLYFS